MPTQIERDASTLLEALAQAPRETFLDGSELVDKTTLEPSRINDAVTLLVESGYADWLRELGTAPFDFTGVTITPRGRYEYQRIMANNEETERARAQEQDRVSPQERVPARPPVPVGSPYGFTDEDWEIVAERKSRVDRLYVVLGYQFESEHYHTEDLRANVEAMFEKTVSLFNERNPISPVSVQFKSLAAGYGEHLFNEITRDIIGSDIAVFEASNLNPNVMLEMGVALTWGVRVLPIKDEGRPRPPSDISGQTWADYKNSAREFIDSDHQTKLVRMIERAVRKKGKGVI